MIKPIKIVEIKSEIGAGTRGASMGVDAIKIAALDFGSPFFKRFKSVEIPHENNLLLEPIIHDYAKRIKGIYSLNDRLSKEIAKIIKSDQVPIVLAGDHSSALGTISGIKMAHPEKRLGVIWIDAHADLHSPYTTPTGNLHGMPLAASLAEDNIENKVNVGLIAQEVLKVMPELVTEDANGMLGVKYTELVPVLIAAVKELKQELETIKNNKDEHK